MDSDKKYKLIVLITSANIFGNEEPLKQITNKYMNLYPDQIKHFYIEFIPNLDEDVKEDGNYLYFKGTEHRNYMYHKTIYALEYINKHYNYDYVLRTTLGTFYVLDNVLKYLSTVPLHNYAGGFACFNSFITGTGIFLSKDSSYKLVNEGRREIYYNSFETFIYDDVSISNTIRRCNIPIYYIGNDYIMRFVTEGEVSENKPYDPNIDYPLNTLYFRIKYQPNRQIDILYNKLFLKKIYNIDVEL